MSERTDKQIAQAVIKEWRCGSGMAGTVSPALSMLELLIVRHEESFTIEGACEALGQKVKQGLQDASAAGAREEGRQGQ